MDGDLQFKTLISDLYVYRGTADAGQLSWETITFHYSLGRDIYLENIFVHINACGDSCCPCTQHW